jgi:tRNA A37 threonylcarbamoyladenosine synthetase subunit TsaC/SUA5/YrdC
MSGVIDHKAEAARAFLALQSGGIAIIPNDVGYAAVASHYDALKRIFDTKKRAPSKLNAMIGDKGLHQRLHSCSTRAREIVIAITESYDLPLGVIAPADFNDPFLAELDSRVTNASTLEGTLLMLMNAGQFHHEICQLSNAANMPIFGSSANVSLHGTKFEVDQIEQEILSIADVVVDYGVLKYKPYACSSTLLDVEAMRICRKGVAYESIVWIMKRHFGIDVEQTLV